MAEWNVRANDLFLRAAEIESPAERRHFLDQECGDDPALRVQVEALLAASAKVGSFLNRPAAQALGEDEGTVASDPSAEGPGSVIGPYKLLQQIGEGGMGVVYMAEQTEPVRRRVALKVVKPGMDSGQVVARFEAERQALALMDHPNIARVFDAGTTASGRPYFVMELVHGVPITDYCDDNGLTPAERLHLFLPVCQAVQHAHQKGVIHRDLKPSNVLVCLYDGVPVPKVIDFGVAKATSQSLTERTMFTQFGTLVGTLEYMSPEQVEMSQLGVDTRSDVYALGVLLYELLTGAPPFDRRRFQAAAFDEIRRILKEEEPPRPSTRLSTLGESLSAVSAKRKTQPAKLSALVRGDLDWVVMKALEKDRNRRYESASAFAADVRRFLAGEAVEARPPSGWYRFRKMARRNRAALTTALVVAAALLLGTAVSVWQAVRATRAEALATDRLDLALGNADRARKSERTAREERDATNAAREQLRRTLYVSDMNLVQAAQEAGNTGRVVELLRRQVPARGESDLRGFEWHYWWRHYRGDRRTVEVPGLRDGPAAFSPDGTRVACAAYDPGSRRLQVKIWDTADGELRLTLRAPRRPPKTSPREQAEVLFSPDGWRIAAVVSVPEPEDRTEVRLWDAATGKELLTIPDANGCANGHVAFSPDGKRLVAPGQFGEGTKSVGIRVWDVATGKALATLSGGVLCGGLAFSPDGKRLALWERTWDNPGKGPAYDIIVRDAAGKELRAIKGVSDLPLNLAFSPDGKHLAAAVRILRRKGGGVGEVGALKVWETTTGREGFSIELVPTNSFAMAFSPDGTRLAGFGSDLSVRVWDAATGALRQTLEGHTGAATAAAFSPDGQRLYSAGSDGTVKVWDATAGAAPPRRGEFVYNAALSPDGTRVALTRPGRVVVRDLAGKEPLRVEEPDFYIPSLAFNADGRRLAVAGALRGEQPEQTRYRVKVWDLAAREVRLTLDGPTRRGAGGPGPMRVAFSPDGTRLAATFWGRGEEGPDSAGEVKVWDAATGNELFVLRGTSHAFTDVAFSPDGRRLASTAVSETQGGQVKLWDAATGKELLTLKGAGWHVGGLAFRPDGRRLAVGGFGPAGSSEVKVWDTTTGEALVTLKGHGGGVYYVAFSPDGRRIATAERSETPESEIHLWGAATGRQLLTLKHDCDVVAELVFSPDGSRLFSAGRFINRRGDPVKVWDATPLPAK
jgi:WD40 repeat protein/serine/threonine protein kinase